MLVELTVGLLLVKGTFRMARNGWMCRWPCLYNILSTFHLLRWCFVSKIVFLTHTRARVRRLVRPAWWNVVASPII